MSDLPHELVENARPGRQEVVREAESYRRRHPEATCSDRAAAALNAIEAVGGRTARRAEVERAWREGGPR